MTINWKDVAVEAAYDAWAKCDGGATTAWLAALTAAAEAQGLTAPTPQPVGERRWVSMVRGNDGDLIGITSDGTAWLAPGNYPTGAERWLPMSPPPPAPEATP